MAESIVATADQIGSAVAALAASIATDASLPALIGIHTGGVPLARRLAAAIGPLVGSAIDFGTLDITLYRDDLAGRALPVVRGSDIPFALEGRRVVLVDDVLFTGRTVRAALNVIADYGRPSRVQLCVLVDRGNRELPIAADFCGFKLETSAQQKVRVRLVEDGAGRDEIVLLSE